MHSLWYFLIDHKQFTALIAVALIVGGFVSVLFIPKESAPEVEIPVAVVTTTLRGASAEDVAELITKKIEKEVSSVARINKMTSSSGEGISSVVAEFEASANLDQSIQDVKDAVDRAKPSLPRDADEPSVIRINFSDQPILILSLSGGLPPAEFTKLGEDIAEDIERISGVSRVDVSGSRDREVTVVVRRESLESFGLTLSEIAQAIGASNTSLPVGSITVSGIQYPVEFNGSLDEPNDLYSVTVGSAAGRPVYLSDVADIVDGLETARTISRVSVEGEPAEPSITLNVFKRPGANIIEATNNVKDRLEELKDTTLAGITYRVTFSSGEQIIDDLTELTRVGFETVVLVLLCLLITIGWRESLVAGLSIPLSFVIAFIGLYVSGNTINFVSLFSLILAIGILVDSGIVVTEAIHTRYKKLGDATLAAKEAIREYAWPLIAGTMTTVAVFVPLFFISGVVGEFISSIPFTIIFVLIASIFVALGLVPLLAILFTRKEMNALEMRQEEWNRRVNDAYRVWLKAKLNDRRFQRYFLRGTAVAFVLALALPIAGIVQTTFFPGEDIDLAYFEIEMKHGTTLEQTDLAARAVEELLYGDPNIETFTTTVGATSPFSGGGGAMDVASAAKYSNITINLIPRESRDESSVEFVDRYRKELSAFNNFTVRVYEPDNGPPSGAPLLITMTGENLDSVSAAVDKAESVLVDIPGATEVTTTTKDDSVQFSLTVDRAKAAAVGLSPAQIALTLRTAVSGTVATTISREDGDIDVVVSTNLNPEWREPSETTRTTLESLTNLSVRTPTGSVLLGSLLTSTVERSNAVIRREDQENIGQVSAYVGDGFTAAEVSSEFESAMASVTLPDGVAMKVGGETEDVDQSFMEMFVSLLGGMVLMLAILVLEFNSFRYAGYLLMLIPLSLIGVIGGLGLTGQPISFPSLLGVIALAGVIINHAIILMDSVIVRMKDPQGRNLEDVVVDAAASRLRPIFLTTVTTVVGMIPLSVASGLWGPLAFAIMFGLTFAMVLTLVLTPILVYRHPGNQYWKN